MNEKKIDYIKSIKLNKEDWRLVYDNDSPMLECPGCERRVTVGIYTYQVPWNFCPYCGRQNKSQLMWIPWDEWLDIYRNTYI